MQLFSTTVIIIIVNCIVSYLAINNPQLMNRLLLIPYWVERRNEYYRFITSGFIHANYYPHLLFNMFSLYFFGHIAESFLGTGLYVLFYLSAIVVSDIPTYLKNRHNSNYSSLGASGAVAAVIFASIILHPINTILIYFIPMPAIVFGILYLIYSFFMDKKSRGNVNHSAHLYGAIYGLVFIALYDYEMLLKMFNKILGAIQGLLG